MINTYRKAIYAACRSTGLEVYDYWVTDKDYPYIIISEVDEYEYDYKLNSRTEYTFTLDIFDKQKGKTSVVNYSKEIITILKGLDGVGLQIETRHLNDVEPNVAHTKIRLRFVKYKEIE